jgi:IS5 family transposase
MKNGALISFEIEQQRRRTMRQKSDPQRYFDWSVASSTKVVLDYEAKYQRISEILDENPQFLDFVHRDLKPLSSDKPRNRRGRKADFTSENVLRALIVHQLEGTSLRDTIVRIAHSPFLQHFIRLGVRRVMHYSFLDKCFKLIQPGTWERINGGLRDYAIEHGQLDDSRLRVDTTVVEANIHWPTDSSLLWDSWRTLYRLFEALREIQPSAIPQRFHQKKVKKLHLFITRYVKSPSKRRQRAVRKRQRMLLEQMERIVDVAADLVEKAKADNGLYLGCLVEEIASFLPKIEKVLEVTRRAWLQGETVRASERIFSIFEDHVELIKRGRRHKPVEFGHMVLLGQTPEKFITQYDVMEKRIPDCQLGERILAEHEASFGSPPKELAADKGFRGKPEVMERLRSKVKVVAIPERLKDWADETMVTLQHFRAGIEGSISVLKRAFGLLRCQYRSFKSFQCHVGLGVFCHNLVTLGGAGMG